MCIKLGTIYYQKSNNLTGEEVVYLKSKSKNSIVVSLIDRKNIKHIKYNIYNSEGTTILNETFDIFNLIIKTRYMNTKVLSLQFQEKSLDINLLLSPKEK